MSKTKSDLIKRRDIVFSELHPDPNQVRSAAALLGALPGIQGTDQRSSHCLEVTYDVRMLTLRVIDEALVKLGFHLDNSLLIRLKRALYDYTEETQRANLGYRYNVNSTQGVFVNRYEHLPHGCRDERPQHWREYL